ncbi:MAG: D-alanyl-D-alanine carboxypeptidase family protein [Methylovulum sp.]|nr:D-alanyl-D-alanine carboxypeptidase family protein [Methylovulum sp.]
MKLILLILMPLYLSLASGISYGRHAAILIDADNGRIVHEEEATHSWYPASLTKVMTLYMAYAALDQRQIQLHDNMIVSHHASRQPTSKLGLRAGERLTVQDAILAIITRSANDASVVLAEHLGGNEENFAAKMTAKAHALGMYDTHFMNATGLPHQWQVTTPRDLALLAWKIRRDFPDFYPYFAAHSFYFRGQELKGINKFTAGYPGAEGMKTGFTCGSGYNLMSSAQQNGRRLIGVVMGGKTSAERYQLMIKMMNDGFADRLGAYPEKYITAIPSKFSGIAPYQLGCGKGAPAHLTTAHLSQKKHGPTHHLTGKSKKAAKISYAGRKINKSSSKTKLVSKSKPSKTRYRRT